MIKAYFENIYQILHTVEQTQYDNLVAGARLIADATISGKNIFAFGASHAGLLAFELYYRTGGMATINPVRAPGLALDVDPAPMTSQMERMPEYGRIIIDAQPIKSGDVVIIHSVSGRNTVTIDAAICAKEKGAIVIALTNMNMSMSVSSRHPSGKKLYEVADLVLDNCGCIGDASLLLEKVPEKIAPTSTVVGAAILNAMIAESIRMIANEGVMPPVFVSANLDGGDKHNKEIISMYREHIFYM